MRSLPGPQLPQLRHVPLPERPQPLTYLFVSHQQEEHELCPLLDWYFGNLQALQFFPLPA